MNKKKIHYSTPCIDFTDIQAVNKVLKSDYLTTGPVTKKFESKISKFVGVRFSVAVNSATSALHLACISLGIRKNDHVWVVSNGFVASANAAAHLGAKIDFLDIELSTYNLDIEYLENKLKKTKFKPKLLIIVDFAGHPCRLNKIKNLSKKYRFKILQDSSHALGAKYENSKIGNCKYSDLTVFSFHPVKTITTGEGGIITTNEKNIYNKLARLRSHGIVREKKFLLKKKLPKWYYEQVDLGFNYRMTDIQSALGVSQLKKINMFIKKRNQIAARYNLLLKGLPVILPKKTHKVLSTYHLYVIRVDNKIIKRDKLYNEFIKNNIGVNLHYIPIHKQPFYKKYLKKKVYLPNAEKYYKTALSLPIHPKLTFSDLERIVKIIKKSIKR